MNALVNTQHIFTYLLRAFVAVMLFALPIMLTQSSPPNQLAQIIASGELHIASKNGPTTYYEGPYGFQGIEYELAEGFARELGVRLVIKEERDLTNLLESIGSRVSFAAAGLTVTPQRQKDFVFTEPYMSVTEQLIYRRGKVKPQAIEDIIGKKIVVIANSAHAETLKQLQREYPELSWEEQKDIEMLDLLEMVHTGKIDYTVVDSHVFITNRAIYPRARVAMDISEPRHIAWAFPKNQDDSLFLAAQQYMNDRSSIAFASRLKKKYFTTENIINETNALTLSIRVEERLPKWKSLFQKTAKEFGLDWLFLAAISYQESHWNADAKSPTGVRGLMMLTRATASDLGIKDRTDPKQSIYGGAKYFTQVLKRIPSEIQEPDRTWMALASYNVGFGHLQDARKITRSKGKNPNLWKDVKESLPLLSKPSYYKKTRHGYARGWEPVKYVENIRKFHKILVLHDQIEKRKNIAKDKNKDKKPLEPVDYSQAPGDANLSLL